MENRCLWAVWAYSREHDPLLSGEEEFAFNKHPSRGPTPRGPEISWGFVRRRNCLRSGHKAVLVMPIEKLGIRPVGWPSRREQRVATHLEVLLAVVELVL